MKDMFHCVSRRSFIAAAGAAAVSFGLAACGAKTNDSASKEKQNKTDSKSDSKGGSKNTSTALVVFAAASLTESLTEIGNLFKRKNSGVDVKFSFDSSGTLKTQIQEGASCDVFLSAGQKQMNALDAQAKKQDGKALDFIDHSTRFDILENKVVLCVPDENRKNVKNFNNLAAMLREGEVLLGMGNSDVPVGQYASKILKYYRLDEAELARVGCITYGTNVKEVTTQIKEASVDCGVIYQTDATSAGLRIVGEATEEMCGRVVYPAAILKAAPHAELAKKFLEFLQTPDASACFKKIGFTPLTKR